MAEAEDFIVDLDSSQPESMALVPCTRLALNGDLVDGDFSSPQSLNGSSKHSESEIDANPAPLCSIPPTLD